MAYKAEIFIIWPFTDPRPNFLPLSMGTWLCGHTLGCVCVPGCVAMHSYMACVHIHSVYLDVRGCGYAHGCVGTHSCVHMLGCVAMYDCVCPDVCAQVHVCVCVHIGV